jgi:cell filamentation protein, protein adenylyltransferase
MVVKYEKPRDFMRYELVSIALDLAEAKAAVISLSTIPYQRRWVEALQEVQLKREVAGTSRIEGAEFTEKELDAAMRETPEQLFTRSQRQAHAAMLTYRWLAKTANELPVNGELIKEIHRRIVSGADDDHCPPGRLRGRDHNVVFGFPQHRGVDGGPVCEECFQELCRALEREFPQHDPLIQALAAHYHLGAMHPFLDGNGRTARALEAAILHRAGLHDTLIAMSNYYYDEKPAYLKALSEARAGNHDLTPFLQFGLRGIALQCRRLSAEIAREVKKALFKNVMYDLFNRLFSTRKRVIAKRQLDILKLLLEKEEVPWELIIREMERHYASLANPLKALTRDMDYLLYLKAVEVETVGPRKFKFKINLEWPMFITETSFFEAVNRLPSGKTYSFLSER